MTDRPNSTYIPPELPPATRLGMALGKLRQVGLTTDEQALLNSEVNKARTELTTKH